MSDNSTFKYWPSGLPKMKEIKKDRRCPHCRSTAPRVDCVQCARPMCEDCISILPSVGKVCGLCYDRAIEPQEDDNP